MRSHWKLLQLKNLKSVSWAIGTSRGWKPQMPVKHGRFRSISLWWSRGCCYMGTQQVATSGLCCSFPAWFWGQWCLCFCERPWHRSECASVICPRCRGKRVSVRCGIFYRKDCVTLIMVTERKFSGTEGKALFQGVNSRNARYCWELVSLWDTGF